MKSILLLVLSITSAISTMAQKSSEKVKKLGNDPIIFIDSVNVYKSELMQYKPTEIARITIYDEKEAQAIFGKDGKDGAVYAFTKKYAKSMYWLYFQSKSDDYKNLVPSPESDTVVQYILNGRVLKDDFAGDLHLINDEVFKSIELLSQETLEKDFNIFDKKIGFLIKSDIPKNLYKGKERF